VPVAVVTGGARGIGAAIAAVLAQRGLEVVRLDREPGEGVVVCDVGDPAQVEAVAVEVGPVQVLVNNAGQWIFGALEDVTPADFDAVLRTNLGGTFHCTQSFGRSMLAAGTGAIVNVVSIAAAAANPMVGAYSASKAGVLALTRQTALEWGPRGVRANAVGPGLVPTPGTGTVYDDPDVRAVRASAVPLRRLAEPQDIANVVAFLASSEAAYVNGQVLYVDGGLSQALMTLLPRPAGVAGPSRGGAAEVVRRHLRAVERLDLTGMSADYALDAVLERGGERHEGREAIAAYFASVPARLAGRTVSFDDIREEPDGSVVVRWTIGAEAAGHDRFVVRDGWIARQRVQLDGTDF
jgi:NAD(P)-dependent dehydrogenase (short-subunit alcohol dehydrogenase family)/ketosteroid isomerase-like protein